MTKYIWLLAAGTLSAATLNMTLAPLPVKAEIQYPWCAQYSGDDGDGGVNCGFVTLAQCRATISGIGGWCYENPAYPAARRRPK
jgi:hypothetical protein